jgi:hypothetical protein
LAEVPAPPASQLSGNFGAQNVLLSQGTALMDIDATLRELWREKKRLEREIARLEALLGRFKVVSRRGRKSMPPEERAQVAQRMKAYWEKRRGES